MQAAMATKKVTKKKEKVAVSKEAKGEGRKALSARFVSFTFGATIPTQSFGNIQPHITVESATYEDARDFAIPKIMELYEKYVEIKPEFMGKITVHEKEVVPVVPPQELNKQPVPGTVPQPTTPAQPAATSPGSDANASADVPDSEPVKKAKKAIELAMTYDAVKLIEEQIMKSVKIKPEEKPALYELTLKRAKALK
jgi:hypothetical protein